MPTPIVLRRDGSAFDLAVTGGYAADRLGSAFLAGYRAALRRLVPSLGPDEAAALCATEEGGAHPRAIQTVWVDGRVTGKKTYVTMATQARKLLVAVREPSGGLRMVSVASDAPGVTLVGQPPTPFVPEITHAAAIFDGAAGELLPGDGYTDYLKPFRTIEDIHVFAAGLSYLCAAGGRAGVADDVLARLWSVVGALAYLAVEDPLAPTTHVALAGALDLGRQLADVMSLEGLGDEERARIVRDRPIFRVADKVRGMRFASAMEKLRVIIQK